MGAFCKLFGFGWDCQYDIYIDNNVVNQEAEILQLRERLDRERRMAAERERRMRYSRWNIPTINVRLGNNPVHHRRHRH